MKKSGKIFSGILAAYLLTLFLLPCCDNCDSRESGSSLTAQTTHDHQNEDNDACSPFCSCACCSSLISIDHSAEINAFIPSGVKLFSAFTQSFFFAFTDDCWQPPRSV